ncbi:FKBP-type peptidyl-prolyl cis-trans isomerase [Chitinophaga sp.]|uniref:FKBP-type peptidyl-prolyl cis-trans isomerase n=1 Tax=Chitinophaga sp. TaxID=1869181 RepID=UPI0031DD37A5
MKLFLQAIFFLLYLSACSKSADGNLNASSPSTVVSQEYSIQSYISSHGLAMTRDTSGMYYKIMDIGDTTKIMNLKSIPTLIYTRSNLRDSLLDASFGSTDFDGRQLKDHIAGWQIGLRKIGKGGTIFMIIPSRLGFGDVAVGNIIPANTVLVCTVQLVDYK